MSTSESIPTQLLQSPSFQLERLRRKTRDAVELELAAKGTTLREYWTLTCLVEENAGSQSALCSMLGIDASDMVRIIDALQEHKWVKRERDKKDRRRQIVLATKKGRSAQKEIAAVVAAAEDRALDESTGKQLKHLRKLAEAIIAAEQD